MATAVEPVPSVPPTRATKARSIQNGRATGDSDAATVAEMPVSLLFYN